ncbi:class I SAM-dependent methyltransferase [Vibrio fujianensis]|uniref:class I SAM-dependent methyltransferase n=1 Tax=Vibrio fujianensis TaxID=1974215 RepID=UPI000C167674|nr:class I SAM-dependent methyltransferase [Vibrio fujianensis]
MNITALNQFFTELHQQLENAPNEVRRLFHGRGRKWPGLEQLTADWLQGQLVVTLYKEVDAKYLQVLTQGLMALANSTLWQTKAGQCILLQYRYANGAPSQVIVGELNTHPIVQENGLSYQLTVGTNQNMGLFLDMRLGREWVRSQSEHKTVLNLFAYTCGFSVAAIAGGADKVVNVDMARGSLAKGRENHNLNGHSLNQVNFLGYDIFKSWRKITHSGPYDLIIIDPPSFQKGSFALTKDYQRILRRLPELLAEQGQVLACVNSPMVSSNFLIDGMKQEAPQLNFQYRLENPPEFADIDHEASLKALVFR